MKFFQGSKQMDRSYFRPERTAEKVRGLKISAHSRRDVYVYGKLERSNRAVCSEYNSVGFHYKPPRVEIL